MIAIKVALPQNDSIKITVNAVVFKAVDVSVSLWKMSPTLEAVVAFVAGSILIKVPDY